MTEKKTYTKLPSVPSLLRASWELFQETWLTYLKLVGLVIAYLFLGALIGIVISLPVSFIIAGSPHFQLFSHLTAFHIAVLALLVVWAIFYVLSIIAIAVIVPIVRIFILHEKENTSLLTLIQQSKQFFLPYLFTMLLSVVVIVGGMSLLVLPGILVAFFFAFVGYEIVLEKQSGILALKRSYFLVKNHFWETFIRLLLLEVILLILSSGFDRLAGGNVLFALVNLLYTFLAAWFSQTYVYTLYTHLRARTNVTEKVSLRWIWIVSVIGWVILVLVLIGVVTGLAHLPNVQPTDLYPIPGNAV